MAQSNLSLSDLVIQLEKAGHDVVDAELKASQLKEDQRPFLAALMNQLSDTKSGEAKLDRLARGSNQFRDFNNGMNLAKAEAAHKRVRYENLARFYEAKRSELAMERERMKALKDIT